MEGQDLQHTLKRVQVCIPRAACGGVRCLFFGKRGAVFQLRLVHGRPGVIHSLDEFETSELSRELGAVERAIGVEPNGNTLYRLPSGVYVHCYGESIRCSDFKLQDASHFFEFDNSLPITLPSGSMDVRPFLFGGEDLVLVRGGANSTKYPWHGTGVKARGLAACRRFFRHFH